MAEILRFIMQTYILMKIMTLSLYQNHDNMKYINYVMLDYYILHFVCISIHSPMTFLGHHAPPSKSWSKRAKCGPTDLKSKAEEAVISSSLMWPFSIPSGTTQTVEPLWNNKKKSSMN